MKTRLVALVTAGLAVGFACGWVVAQAQNVNKLSPDEVWTNQWVTDVTLLVRNGHNTEPLTPEQTQSIIRSGLDVDSMVLGRAYDSMPQTLKDRIMFYVPAARAIASAQGDVSATNGTSDLLKFVNCMQKVRLHGGLVKACIDASPK